MELTHNHRLVTYGTLAPGQINHRQLDGLVGQWQRGIVRGRLVEEGWGAAHGCPGIVLDPSGEEVQVHIFVSVDLPDHWQRLDDFEGDGYQRTKVEVVTASGPVAGSIYQLKY